MDVSTLASSATTASLSGALGPQRVRRARVAGVVREPPQRVRWSRVTLSFQSRASGAACTTACAAAAEWSAGTQPGRPHHPWRATAAMAVPAHVSGTHGSAPLPMTGSRTTRIRLERGPVGRVTITRPCREDGMNRQHRARRMVRPDRGRWCGRVRSPHTGGPFSLTPVRVRQIQRPQSWSLSWRIPDGAMALANAPFTRFGMAYGTHGHRRRFGPCSPV